MVSWRCVLVVSGVMGLGALAAGRVERCSPFLARIQPRRREWRAALGLPLGLTGES